MTVRKQVKVVNTLGLHVRPATQLAQTAMKFKSKITIIKDGVSVNAKSSVALLTIAAVKDSLLTIIADGEDAEEALNAICSLIESGFGEK